MKLRICTQNVRGLGHTHTCTTLQQFWNDHHLDIVLLQETHLSSSTETTMELLLNKTWECIWSHYQPRRPHAFEQRRGRPSAGVAILIRRSRLTENGGTIKIQNIRKNGGRIISVQLKWLGHTFHLSNVYMPNVHREQWTFMNTVLSSHKDSFGEQDYIIGGDMNFVEDQELDSSSTVRIYSRSEQHTLTHWTTMFPESLELHGRSLREQAAYTHKATNGTLARLDRFYGSQSLEPFIQQVRVLTPRILENVSDHRPVMLDLTPKAQPAPTQHRQGLHRRRQVHSSFRRDGALKTQFMDAAAALIDEYLLMDPPCLVSQWPEFKSRLSSLSNHFSRQYVAHLREQVKALEQDENRDPVQEFSLAQQQVKLTLAEYNNPSWLERNDTMCPVLSRRILPPSSTRTITCLRSTGGNIVSTTQGCADILVNHYASISSQPMISEMAQEDLLDLLTPADQAAFTMANASPLVSPDEVHQIMKRMGPRAPGEDGIKIVLYKLLARRGHELLAKLFSAMLDCGLTPHWFTDGLIVSIHKGGDRTDPSNYRPITLLNYDYRIFACVLKNRLTVPMQRLIADTQTAFLPGRQSATNIWTLQMLPHWLQAEDRYAYIAICDFRKAYDTVDRSLLFKTFRRLGLPAALVTGLKLLLTATRSRAYLHGCFSGYRYFVAGVRQGCPASPILYLFVGHLLHRHLHHFQIGVTLNCRIGLPGLPSELADPDQSLSRDQIEARFHPNLAAAPDLVGPLQYADDTNTITAPHQVGEFLEAMSTFAGATGQHLNLDKTHLLPIGALPAELPSQVHGLQVVSQASILGLTFHQGTAAPTANWGHIMDRVEATHAKLNGSNLSLFGKYRAWSTFGLSKILYHAEFLSLPATVSDRIDRLSREFLGGQRNSWKLSILSAHPRQGGLGCLPLGAHLQARRTKWIIKLLLSGTQALWSKLAWNLAIIYPSSLRRGPLLPMILADLRDKITFPAFDEGPNDSPHSNGPLDLEVLKWGMQRLLPPFWIQSSSSLGWTVGNQHITLWTYTVRQGTRLLTRADQTARQERYNLWLAGIDTELASVNIHQVLTKLWKAPIHNKWKLPFWEVIQNAQINAERMRADSPCGCATSAPCPGRCHHFLECPPARAVYDTLATLLAQRTIVGNIWTADPPDGYPQNLWSIICLAAVYAIDSGRCYIYRHTTLKGRPPDVSVGWSARKVATETLWNLLGYYSTRLPPGEPWHAQLPILFWDINTTRWRIAPPAPPTSGDSSSIVALSD